MSMIPPDYAGSKVDSARTLQDLIRSGEDINNYIKNAVDKALKKKEEEESSQFKKAMIIVGSHLITAPLITLIYYLIYKWLVK